MGTEFAYIQVVCQVSSFLGLPVQSSTNLTNITAFVDWWISNQAMESIAVDIVLPLTSNHNVLYYRWQASKICCTLNAGICMIQMDIDEEPTSTICKKPSWPVCMKNPDWRFWTWNSILHRSIVIIIILINNKCSRIEPFIFMFHFRLCYKSASHCWITSLIRIKFLVCTVYKAYISGT